MNYLAICANIVSLTVNECDIIYTQVDVKTLWHVWMHPIIITHRVRLITDDSRLTVVTVWESHSGKSTAGKGESLGSSTLPLLW